MKLHRGWPMALVLSLAPSAGPHADDATEAPAWWFLSACRECPDGVLAFSTWTEVGGGADGPVNALLATPGRLYVGGEFTHAGGGAFDHVAAWNGTSWSALGGPLGEGVNGPVNAFSVYNDNPPIIWVGGAFTSAGGVEVSNVAVWCNVGECETVWVPMHHRLLVPNPVGLDGPVSAFARSAQSNPAAGGYIGGSFTREFFLLSGGTFQDSLFLGTYFVLSDPGGFHVHHATSNAFEVLGFDSPVLALAVPEDESGVFIGGSFTSASLDAVPFPASHVVFWDEVTPAALGSGTDAPVRALAVLDDDLYAGGDFQAAGNAPASFIARWDGSAWSDVDGGADGPVHALTTGNLGCGDDLFAGGAFTHVGSPPMASALAARWTGFSWSDISQGLFGATEGDEVRAIAVWDDGTGRALYVGGEFDTVVADNLAKWACTPYEFCIPCFVEVDDCPFCPIWFFDQEGDGLPEWIQCEAGGEQIALRPGTEVEACGARVRLGTAEADVIRLGESPARGVRGTLVFGGPGDDEIIGGSLADVILGGDGDDVLQGGAGGDDLLYGGAGSDQLFGNLGDDALSGGSANDYLNGGDGRDLLGGGDGDDTLLGGSGDDALLGGAGIDRLAGGPGKDRERQD